jgi:energy-coupling factor transport system ATP-binding protein
VDLAWAAERHPSSLSVGERQRAAIAVVLAGDPEVLLLDEPTRGMDPWHKRQLMQVLNRVQARGVGILMATHDIEMAAGIAHRVVMLGDGGIVAIGAPEEVLTDSLTYSTQVNKILGGAWLTVQQVIAAAQQESQPE